jgi:hypothetical protein
MYLGTAFALLQGTFFYIHAYPRIEKFGQKISAPAGIRTQHLQVERLTLIYSLVFCS